jgi:hypothetical protein
VRQAGGTDLPSVAKTEKLNAHMTLQHSGMPGYSPNRRTQSASAGVDGPSLGPRHKLSPAELLRGAFLEKATARVCLASIAPARSGRVPWGDFPMHRFLFAATAIAAVAAVAASMMGGPQVIDDHAHRQCVAAGYTPGAPLYVQCRAQVIQPSAAEHEAVAR